MLCPISEYVLIFTTGNYHLLMIPCNSKMVFMFAPFYLSGFMCLQGWLSFFFLDLVSVKPQNSGKKLYS